MAAAGEPLDADGVDMLWFSLKSDGAKPSRRFASWGVMYILAEPCGAGGGPMIRCYSCCDIETIRTNGSVRGRGGRVSPS